MFLFAFSELYVETRCYITLFRNVYLRKCIKQTFCFLFEANYNIHFVCMKCRFHKFVLWRYIKGVDYNAFPITHSFSFSSNVSKNLQQAL